MTNFEKFHKMDKQELTKFICENILSCTFCAYNKSDLKYSCYYCEYQNIPFITVKCMEGIKLFLDSEVE